jgi:hypothetical protein
MPEDDTRPASLDVQEVNFTGPFDREVRVSADRQTITHRVGYGAPEAGQA